MNIEKAVNYKPCDYFATKITQPECTFKPINSNIIFNPVSVSVLPANANWFDMEDFRQFKYGPFNFNFINANNCIIAGIKFNISYNCRGKFNSIGSYLSDVAVSPIGLFANPGYYFTCNVTASDPINYGTKLNPIAGINLKIQMEVKSYNKLMLNENGEFSTNIENSNNFSDCKKSLESTNSIYLGNSNTVQQYLIVNVRGDCNTSIISCYGY